jgi:hypothetical protein
LIPVALDARRMTTADDGSLLIFERAGSVANARFIPCRSPLLAIEPRIKHSKFFGGGAPWQLLGVATPDPDASEAPQPDATGSKRAGC